MVVFEAIISTVKFTQLDGISPATMTGVRRSPDGSSFNLHVCCSSVTYSVGVWRIKIQGEKKIYIQSIRNKKGAGFEYKITIQ